MKDFYTIWQQQNCIVLQFDSLDRTNKLNSESILSLTREFESLRLSAERDEIKAVVITGNDKFFSAGADLNEIVQLSGPEAFAFSRRGQQLMHSIEHFPVPVAAAIQGYCMGGGMDLVLACHVRIASRNAVFGHRGATLGVITGWGGTQRLPRLIGRARALQMFVLAETINAETALQLGLLDALADHPVEAAIAIASGSVL